MVKYVIKNYNMTFSISVLVSSLDPYKSSAIALGWYGSLGIKPGPIWKRPWNNLYLSPLILKYPSLFCPYICLQWRRLLIRKCISPDIKGSLFILSLSLFKMSSVEKKIYLPWFYSFPLYSVLMFVDNGIFWYKNKHGNSLFYLVSFLLDLKSNH